MHHHAPDIFVLWDENFDEQMAITFVSKFRSAGLQVKLVGLQGGQAAGRYGVGLIADMTLSQALPLANSANGVVLPCHSPHFREIDNDPRVQIFFQAASKNKAEFMTGQVRVSELERFMNPVDVTRCLVNPGVDESADLIKGRLSMLTQL